MHGRISIKFNLDKWTEFCVHTAYICLIRDDIKTKQLQWCGHAQRMEEGRLPKEVMKWSPPGRRKRGRPKLTRAEGI